MGLFKSVSMPDGVISTDINTRCVSSLTGVDTNTGSRLLPVSTLTKAHSIGMPYFLAKGIFNENFTWNTWFGGVQQNILVGDSEDAEITGSVILLVGSNRSCLIENFKLNNISINIGCIRKCVVKGILTGQLGAGAMITWPLMYNFIKTFNLANYGGYSNSNNDFVIVSQNTIYDFNNYCSSTRNVILNSIFINCVDLYNYTSRSTILNIPIFQYCLFRKATIWKWNGAVIPINYGTYGNVVGDYMGDVISGLYAFANSMVAGQDKNYFLAMIPSTNSSNIFYVDVNGQTCKVVEDRPSILGSKKIFNRYVGDNPVDYSLYLSSDNVALTMSDQLSYVGCYKANAKVLTFGEVMHVNADGSDDLVTVPDMLISDGNGKFHVSTADSVQIRNRVRSDVFNFKRGFNLTAFQSQMKSGLGSRFSMGKFQPYNITDAPTLPQESIEILPYDDAVTPSAFPRFSGMFNGECKMWYHNTGAKINQPVLFNDLQSFFAITTDKSLAEYGTWAVTNADFETYLLSSKTGVALRNIPVYYGRIELNLNYHI